VILQEEKTEKEALIKEAWKPESYKSLRKRMIWRTKMNELLKKELQKLLDENHGCLVFEKDGKITCSSMSGPEPVLEQLEKDRTSFTEHMLPMKL
jgi:hypothetical protein